MTRKNKKFLLVLVSMTILLSACKGKDKTEVTSLPTDEVNIPDVSSEPVLSEYISPLSGLATTDAEIQIKRPIAVMYDNHRAARWQAGITDAEIVYEILAEGNITRYMALFLSNTPERIGSVRSARPYFVLAALEYDAVYVHCGGSEQAFADIKKYKVSDIDEIRNSGPAFYRYKETGKKGEHTLYTDIEKIRNLQATHKYPETANYTAFKFNEKDVELTGDIANEILITYSKDNTTSYIYDETAKVYKRFKDNKQHIDENNKKEVVAKNIIIQKADTKAVDSYGRLDVKLMGSGEGYYLTCGKYIPITWTKDSVSSKTIYKTLSGEEIRLNAGVTWIQVVKLKMAIDIK